MINDSIILLLKKISSLENITDNIFSDILKNYDLSIKDFQKRNTGELKSKLTEAIDFFGKRKERNYFTISSKQDFNELISDNQIHSDWNNTLIFHPLNDHSRSNLKMGDILFCYRQGQFESLNEALDTRGIYAVGVAASDPLVLYPQESGHSQYGIIVCFPILLKNHLRLRNIQMHPLTINLTPYNGNRNDALQQIHEKSHYKTLLSMIVQSNLHLNQYFKDLLNDDISKTILPEALWNKQNIIGKSSVNQNVDYSSFINSLNECGLLFNKNLVFRFISSLLSKQFVLLTGLSGSGKTKLAEAFSCWLCANHSQVCFVSVGADWTNREPLLGFPNALVPGSYVKPDSGVLDLLISAENDPDNPYFLILDEMNLSHVERYFADFLSAMESVKREIKLHPDTAEWRNSDVPPVLNLPRNLYIIGTVNIDETTYMFSPKVLDRAHVIEFRVSKDEMKSFLGKGGNVNLEIISGLGSQMGQSFVEMSNESVAENDNFENELMPFFEKLQEAYAEFGFRTASEISTFIKKCTWLVNGEMTRDEIVDAAIMQKLLTKLHGSRNRIERKLKDLGSLCLHNDGQTVFGDMPADNIRYPVSYEKLKRMHERVVSDGFTSYAEA